MLEELEKLGLTKGESKVYLSLLKLGMSKVGEVIKDCGVSYSKVYDILERLHQKGLVSSTILDNVKHYNALEPHRLVEFLEEKEKEVAAQKEMLGKIMKDLLTITKEHEPSKAQVFFDMSGLRSAYEILLNEKSGDGILRFFYPPHNEVASTFYRKLYPKFKEAKLQLRGIGSIESKPKNLSLPPHIQIKFVDFPVPGTIDVIADKTLIISWTERPTGVLIISKDITDHFIAYFESVWKIAKK